MRTIPPKCPTFQFHLLCWRWGERVTWEEDGVEFLTLDSRQLSKQRCPWVFVYPGLAHERECLNQLPVGFIHRLWMVTEAREWSGLPRENMQWKEGRGPKDSKSTSLLKQRSSKLIYLIVSCVGKNNLSPSVPFKYFNIEFQYMQLNKYCSLGSSKYVTRPLSSGVS